MASTASHLNASISDIEAVAISDYSFFEIIPTPMGPEEVTHLGTVAMSYIDPTTGYQCHASIAATRKDNWKTYLEAYEFVGQPACRI